MEIISSLMHPSMSSDHDVLSFDGDDLIAYQFRKKTNRTLEDDISLNFKTLEKDGVLMHAEGTQGDYITLELVKAQLVFRMSLGMENFTYFNW